MVVTLGTGIGVGVVTVGELFRAGDRTHPEAGHIAVHQAPVPCYCGLPHCWEQAASRTALERLTGAACAAVTPAEAASAAHGGDAGARRAFEQYGVQLAAGLGTLLTVFRPDRVVLGGSAAQYLDLFAAALTAALGRQAPYQWTPPILAAEPGDLAGTVGAAVLARLFTGPVIQLAGGRTGCWNVAMDRAAVLAEFNDQLRRNPAAELGSRVERDEHVTRVISAGDGWSGVLWSGLAGLDPGGADAVIAAEVRRFIDLGRPWEWKYYSYDQPADLPGRLATAGLAAEPAETLLVAEIAQLDLDVRPPAGVELVPVTGADGAAAVVRVHDEVFGGDHAAAGAAITAALQSQPHPVQAVIAAAGDVAVSAGRVDFPDGSDFASLWGGGTLPAWRGRGVFRSLVAYRARLARDRGYRYLQVDASPDSRPILQRLGFTELATTTPFAGLSGGNR